MRISKDRLCWFIVLFFSGIGLSAAAQVVQGGSPVEVSTPTPGIATTELRLSGTVVAAKRANLSVRVDGFVDDVLVDVGAKVSKGDILLVLDDAAERHELDRLVANLDAATATNNEHKRLVEEAKRLTKQKHLPQNELALRQAALNESAARLEAAKAAMLAQQQRLSWHQVTAPFAGVIYRKSTEIGEWVNRGHTVFELVATDNVYVDVQLPQEKLGALNLKTGVQLLSDTNSKQPIPAQVNTIVPVADPSSRTFRARLSPAQPLVPGTSAVAVFNFSAAAEKVLLVSKDAILRNPDGAFSLFTVKQQGDQLLAQRQQVSLGQQIGNQVEVLGGITAADKVVVRGNEILRHDQPVSIVQR